MSEILKEFIEKKEAERKAVREKERNDVLIELGLFKKVYSESDGWSSEYPYRDDSNCDKYFAREVLDISDEDYARILELTKPKVKNNNKMVNVLTIMAVIIFVVGFMIGLIGGSAHYEFEFVTAMYIWVISFFCGLSFLVYAEIIKILHNIYLKME